MRSFFIVCAIVACATGSAFAQQRVQLPNGATGTFVPDGGGQQLPPAPDPNFQQQPAHQGGCGCPVCSRRVLSQQVRERSKTIREITTVTVVEETHPDRIINNAPPPNPCPPQNPCAQPRNSGGGLVPWNQGFVGYRQPQCGSRGPAYGGQAPVTRPIIGFGVNVCGIGGSVAITKSTGAAYVGGNYPPAYAQSG